MQNFSNYNDTRSESCQGSSFSEVHQVQNGGKLLFVNKYS